MSAAALMAAVLLTHQLYRRWPDTAHQQWVFYVCVHALAIVAFARLQAVERARPVRWQSAVGAGACWVAIFESAQCVFCGLLHFGQAATCDLCIEALSQDGYTALSAGAVSALLVALAWRRARHG